VVLFLMGVRASKVVAVEAAKEGLLKDLGLEAALISCFYQGISE